MGSRGGPEGVLMGSKRGSSRGRDWGVHILYQLLRIACVVQFSHENVMLHPTLIITK